MDLISSVGVTLAKRVIDRLVDGLFNNDSSKETLEYYLQHHLEEVENWAATYQVYSMNRAKGVKEESIDLNISLIPRKFRAHNSDNELLSVKTRDVVDEAYLLTNHANFVLLGDPGAGKTTTIKRLCLQMLYGEAAKASDFFEYPLLVRMRDLVVGESLYLKIASIFGLSVDTKVVEYKDSARKIKTRIVQSVNGVDLHLAVSDLLKRTSPIVFLDGLDEIPAGLSREVSQDIKKLSEKSGDYKVVASCRSGDYTMRLGSYDIVEICPLDADRIFDVSSKWLSNPDQFLQRLNSRPYKDMASRPLFLIQLLVIYSLTSDLPEQPSNVYRDMIRLLLKRWDEERQVERNSIYAGFDPDRKLDFLGALSYFITYKTKSKVFSQGDLENAYNWMHERFGLPKKESLTVAREIETHSGIIVEFGHNTYEFSHLSLQEYLCANYLVKDTHSDKFSVYVNSYPHPVAVATCLSSDPTNWFSALILNDKYFGHFSYDSIGSYLSRVAIENPFFSKSDMLGSAILKIVSVYNSSNTVMSTLLNALLTKTNVGESVVLSLKRYGLDVLNSSRHVVYMRAIDLLPNSYGFKTPEICYVTSEFLLSLQKYGLNSIRIYDANESSTTSISIYNKDDINRLLSS